MTPHEDRQSEVAVVIPCHNYGEYLAAALRSLAAQTLLPEEIVVVDDGSTDDTQSVLATVSGELPLLIRVIRHAQPLGVAAAMSAGIAASKAPYFAIVDADDTCEPRYLERLSHALDENPQAGFAYPKMRLVGAEQGVYVTHSYDPARLLFEGNYIPMVSLIRRVAFESTGGFRQLPTHVDWDLWLSLAEMGWSGVLVDEILYNWRRHPGAMTHQPTVSRLKTRLDILSRHRRLVLRYLPWALPWTVAAIWRRIRLRLPGNPRVRRTPSGWVESEAAS